MEYSGDAFHTFMDLDHAIYLAVNGTVTSLPVFIQNILNCVLKTNEAFTGSERHGGKWKTNFSFWGGVSLKMLLTSNRCFWQNYDKIIFVQWKVILSESGEKYAQIKHHLQF